MSLIQEKIHVPFEPVLSRPRHGSGALRSIPSRATVKCPSQPTLRLSTWRTKRATSEGDRRRGRSKMTPCDALRPRRKTSSPKALSNVRRTRPSANARVSTRSSSSPGANSAIQATLCPPCRAARTASPGTFSLARKVATGWSSGQRVGPLVFHHLGRVSVGGSDVVGLELRVVGQYLLVSPPFRQQFHQELDGDTRALDDWLAHQHLRVRDNPVLPVHWECVP